MEHPGKPYSEACERNSAPILTVLGRVFVTPGLVLEIGSGTGQHAAYFAPRLPHVRWQPTDVVAHLPGIRAWCREARAENLLEPVALDVNLPAWPVTRATHVFSANTAHIMSWSEVEKMFSGIGTVLAHDGHFCLYGPFNDHGAYTSDSNARFDRQLRMQHPAMGIRDVDDLIPPARSAGMTLVDDVAMPANNRTLVWQKRENVSPG